MAIGPFNHLVEQRLDDNGNKTMVVGLFAPVLEVTGHIAAGAVHQELLQDEWPSDLSRQFGKQSRELSIIVPNMPGSSELITGLIMPIHETDFTV